MTTAPPTAKQFRRLQRSRASWKQREIRKLRCTVRDLTASRQRWKQRVPQAAAAPAAPVLLPLPVAAVETAAGRP